MKRWLFGFLCGVLFAVSVPLFSPETGRAALKTARDYGLVEAEKAARLPKAPAQQEAERVSKPDLVRDRFLPVEPALVQAPVPVPTVAIRREASTPEVTNSTGQPAAPVIPMPRRKPDIRP
jgi:hypothetical protein